jgi:DMSO/TMAO reductase YedYZ molybdopterin-dependent catalytic subunit
MSKLREMGAPVMWAEGHPGELQAEAWEVGVGGLAENPVTLSYEQILALPRTLVDARLTSVSGFTFGGKWGGVRLTDIFSVVQPLPEASHVQFVSYREIYTTSVPLEVASRERTMLAYDFDGEPLDPDYGGPVRIFCPYLWGYKSAKSVVALKLVDHSISGFWETRGYPDSAQIKPRRIYDVNSGRWRRIPGGEVTEFLD